MQSFFIHFPLHSQFLWLSPIPIVFTRILPRDSHGISTGAPISMEIYTAVLQPMPAPTPILLLWTNTMALVFVKLLMNAEYD